MVKWAAKNETLVIALRQTLDNGEAEAIALATELHPESVLLDDNPSRRQALAQRLRNSQNRPGL
jgi:predicted nucleic acid-binding protein